MKKTTKQPAAKPTPPSTTPDGSKVIGPGVVKRPKRDPATEQAAKEEVPYTPSEQFFRRR